MAIEVRTEHPYIVKVKGVRGGAAIIRNTAMDVAFIVKLHKIGESVEGMVSLYPNLVPAAVYDALSYYHDHQEDIEKEIANQDLESILKRNGLTVDDRGRIVPQSGRSH